ncbi:MAG: extracellular solute-binding protein [Lachnospiraceae bacterium]
MRYVRGIFLFAFLLLAGCGLNSAEGVVSAPSREQRLVIYTSHTESVYAPLIKEFEERTGIWVEVKTGGTLELIECIKEKKENSDCDLLFGGGADTLEANKELFAPYSKERNGTNESWTPFSSSPLVLIYNTKLVRNNPPTGWPDLLKEVWQGEIAYADPQSSDSAYTVLSVLTQMLSGEESKLLAAFRKNIGNCGLVSAEQAVSEVANGNYYIGVTLEETALRSMQEGYDITMVYPEEGTCMQVDGLAIISGCAHEENARLFIEFMLEQDTQQYLAEHLNRRPVRTDVPLPEWLPEDISCISYDVSLGASRQKELLSLWRGLYREVTE